MIRFIKIFLIFVPFAFLYRYLESRYGDSWNTVLVFLAILIFARVILYFYRRAKNIPDNFHD